MAISTTYSPEYNLHQYLKTELPALTFVVNGYGPSSPDDCIDVNVTSGDPQHFYERNDWLLQIMTRSKNIETAKDWSFQSYFKVRNKFGLQLPEASLGSLVFPAIKAYRIVPLQAPSYIGADNAGREMFSFNITLTTT